MRGLWAACAQRARTCGHRTAGVRAPATLSPKGANGTVRREEGAKKSP